MKGSSRLHHRRQRHRQEPSPGWDWPGSIASPAQRLPSRRLPSPGTAVGAGLGPQAASLKAASPRQGGGRAGSAFIYVMLGEERGPGNRLTCKWDFWEVESWRAFSLELSWFPIGNIPQ